MPKKIWLASPHMSDAGYETEFINDAFEKNWIAPLGSNVTGFEEDIMNKIGSKAAAALTTGTAAIHLALRYIGVSKGDVVLCQSLTFSATANPIIYEGATPVFIDSDYETWNMNPNRLEEALQKYKNVKAVIVVHLYGLSADLDRIIEICDKYNVPLIEDAAESLGTAYKGTPTGKFGKFGILSFNGNKIITTSGGGMLVSDDEEAIEKVRFWSTQSREKERHYEHKELGFNYRMSNISAGIGRGQMKVLDERVKKKKYIYAFYKEQFKNISEIELMPINDFNDSNCWLTCITLKGKIKPLDILLKLEEENIESRPIWKPMHMQPFFKKYDYIGSDISENLYKTGLCLPSDTKMTDEDLYRICEIIKGVFFL